MEIQPGQRLGPYEIVARIGAGGMGEVFKARDVRLDRSVAVKVLPAEFSGDAHLRARFEREARTISQLNHPHICALHDVGEEGDVRYLVMELLEGESLADKLARGPLPLSDVLRFGVQIADALDRAHRAGIVHRDLKPGNIMITRNGAKLLDFGLAKNAGILGGAPDGLTQQKSLTQEGMILGTFQYMAPEQLEGLEADARTDIFALGAVLYEMATGVRAFQGTNKTSLIAAIVSQDPKPIAHLQPLTPPAFEHVVSRCLSKSPDDRWQNAHDVAEQLRWIAEAGSQAGVAPGVALRKRSRERLAWTIAALLAIAMGILGWRAIEWRRAAATSVVWDLIPPKGIRFNAVGDSSGASVLSPNGAFVVYSTGTGSASQLWLRTVATGEAKPIGGTELAAFPFWSPDSRRIGFFSSLGTLKRVDIDGGAPLTIAAAAGGRGATWNADGTIVFSPDTQTGLFQVPASGGTPRPLTKVDPSKHTSHRWPWFLPDGKHFLFLAANHQDPAGATNGIYLGSLDGKEPVLLVQSVVNAIYADGYLLFMRGQTLMAQPMSSSGRLSGDAKAIADDVLYDSGIWRGAFSASETGLLVFHTGRVSLLSSLKWVDRGGKDVGTIGEPASYWDLELSPNGEKIAVAIGDPLRQMWIHDVKRNTRTRIPTDGWAGGAVFSPDGTSIYIDVLRNGKSEVIARRVTGGGEAHIASGDTLTVRAASLDGKSLLVEEHGTAIVRVPITPHGPAERLFPQSKSQDMMPEYSPDGKWIAYASDQNGRFEVFVSSAADPSQKWQISSNGGVFARWRGDGRELYYIDFANNVMAVPIETAGEDLTVGTPKSLFSVALRPLCRGYDVTADGQRFLVNVVADQESPNAIAVSNWKTRLNR